MLLKKNFEERELHKNDVLLIMSVFPFVFLIFGIVMSIINNRFISDYYNILRSPAILITDFLEVGGIGPAFINAALIGFFNIYLLRRFKMKINGLIIAALMTVMGFSFFGKNIINIIPIYIGGYLFARNQKIPMKDVIVIIMFATGLAPIISQLMFSENVAFPLNVIVGIVLGILVGFTITPLSTSTLKFHDGYSLYNIGFTAGIIGTVITSFLRTFDIDVMPVSIIYQQYDGHIKILMICLFIYLVVIGLYINRNSLKEYNDFFGYSGRTVTDFTFLVGYGKAFFNMGLLGLMFTTLVIVAGGTLNGPILAGLLTIVGFGAFGKHIKNSYPVALGVVLMALLLRLDLGSTGVLLAILFSTTMAPIAGKFGALMGIVAGIIHLVLVMNIGVVHGGVNLYHNGFSGGIVAGVLVPIIDAFKKEKK